MDIQISSQQYFTVALIRGVRQNKNTWQQVGQLWNYERLHDISHSGLLFVVK